MVMIIQGDDNMRAVRRGVFETNSSSSHSLTLLQVSNNTNVGKLKTGHTYTYKPLGEKWADYEFSKFYQKEFDKLCVCLDLLFYSFSNKGYQLRRLLPNELEKFREKSTDSEYLLTRRYVLNEFKKSAEYKEFQNILKKHNVNFILNDLIIRSAGNKQRYPITCDNLNFDFDFMRDFAIPNGWQNIGEAIENIVFNKNIVLGYSFFSDC
jgi:hypothetical protein